MTDVWRPVVDSIIADWNNGLFENTDDLIERIKVEARQFSAELDPGQTYVFFSRFGDQARDLAMNNDGVGWIGDTVLSQFLTDQEFERFLRNDVFGGDSDAFDRAMQFDLGSPIDEMSREYARSASGKVIVLSNEALQDADPAKSSILFRTEVPELFANNDVTAINGVDKAAYRNVGDRFLAFNDAFNLIEEQFNRHIPDPTNSIPSLDVDSWNDTAQESLGDRLNTGLQEFKAFAARNYCDSLLNALIKLP